MKALLQKEPRPLQRDALVSAFEAVDRFTHHDATQIASGACGVLIERLSEEEAHELKTALGGQGVACEVVDQDDLVKLPEPVKVRQIEVAGDGLVVYDALDRPKTHGWDQVAVVAAGRVRKTDFERKSTLVGRGEAAEMDVRFSEAQSDRVVVDLLVVVGAQMKRFRGFMEELRFPGGNDGREAAFAALVAGLAERATGAEKTQHLDVVGMGQFAGAGYTRRSYQHELVWRIYRWGWAPSAPSLATSAGRPPLVSAENPQLKYGAAITGALCGPITALYAFGMALTWWKIMFCVGAGAVAGYVGPTALSGNREWR